MNITCRYNEGLEGHSQDILRRKGTGGLETGSPNLFAYVNKWQKIWGKWWLKKNKKTLLSGVKDREL